MHMLDLTNYNADAADNLVTKWAKLDTNAKNQSIEPRSNPQSTQLPDGKTLLIVGGDISGYQTVLPRTLSFDVETMSWDTYPGFVDPPFGQRQM